MTNYQMNTYNPMPVAFDRGDGAWLWDTNGNRYLDALGGVAVMFLGHSHPDVVAAIRDQAGRLMHTSNWFHISEQQLLAENLCRVAGMERAFVANSGAEANEAAIKIARLYGAGRNIEHPAILVTEQAFHGRTMATLSAGGSTANQQGFDPLLQGFVRVPYNDLDAVARAMQDNDQLVAVMVEPILGESGIILPEAGYLQGLRDLCDRHRALLMLDEIQTGMGRTGNWFAYQGDGVLPDVVTVAKALGSGVPIGACLARGPAAELFVPGAHGSTFGGNPLACRVGRTVIEVIERDGLLSRAEQLGERILGGLRESLANNPMVTDIRGRGLMLAVEIEREVADLQHIFLRAGLLVNVTGEGSIVRFLPPAVLADAEADLLVDTAAKVINELGDMT